MVLAVEHVLPGCLVLLCGVGEQVQCHHHSHHALHQNYHSTDSSAAEYIPIGEKPTEQNSSETSSASSAAAPSYDVQALALLTLLMVAHNVIEGAAVGLEPSVVGLRQSMLPLAIHKLFDGLVVGISAVKEFSRKTNGQGLGFGAHRCHEEHELAAAGGAVDGGDRLVRPPQVGLRTMLRWTIRRPALLIWAAALPVVLLGCALWDAGGSREGARETSENRSSPPGPGTVLSQGLGAAGFLYLSLVVVLPAEFSGPPGEGAARSPFIRMAKLLAVAVGVWVVGMVAH
jgi:hypothetical protein